jgi:hypothetical protein
MQDNNFRSGFTRKYSFVPPGSSYRPFKQLLALRLSLQSSRQRLLGKMPMNLRLMRVSAYEKTMFMAILMFWASVEYLGTLFPMQRDTRDGLIVVCGDRRELRSIGISL